MINISYSKEEFISLAKDKLKLKNNENAAELLYELLENDHKRCLLVKCFMGIEFKLKYKSDDWVYIDFKSLPSWRIDKDKTLSMPGVLENKFVPCKITFINKADVALYHIEFKCIKEGDTKVVTEGYMVEEAAIYKEVELLGEVLEQMLSYSQNN